MPPLTTRSGRVPAALLLATAVLLTGCAGTDEPEASAETSAGSSAGSAAGSTSSAPSAAPTSEAPAGTTIAVSYAGGQVTGSTGRIPVPVGDQVTISVTSDVADEIHLHGYDVSTPVGPDAPGTLTFQATIPGVFEVELEELGTLLLTVQVG